MRLFTSNFKKLPGAFLIASLLMLITVIVMIMQKPVDYSGYGAAIIDKMQILADAGSPKIVFIGGSNLAFGLDSQQIEKNTGITVVNMGLSLNLGLRFITEQVKEYLAPGDIVVISPEYEYFHGNYLNGEGEYLFETLRLYPGGKKYITSPKQYLQLIQGIPIVFNNHLRSFLRLEGGWLFKERGGVFSRKAFNNKGDMVAHRGQKSKFTEVIAAIRRSGAPEERHFNNDTIVVLNKFHSYLVKRNITVFYIFPCIPESLYGQIKEQVRYIHNRLNSELKITMLGSPEDFIFPDSYFYNTIYHLNDDGLEFRMKKLTYFLKNALVLQERNSGNAAPLR